MSRLLIISLIAGAVAALIADRKGRDWLTWCVASILFPFALLVLFALPALPKPGVTKRCGRCGSVMGEREANCPSCGTESPIEMVECPKCGTFVPPGDKCPSCEDRP